MHVRTVAYLAFATLLTGCPDDSMNPGRLDLSDGSGQAGARHKDDGSSLGVRPGLRGRRRAGPERSRRRQANRRAVQCRPGDVLQIRHWNDDKFNVGWHP